jgi:high-affinity iron transporter
MCMVTYMIIFMQRHARGLKRDLEGAAASALASGSSRALVMMALLAVLREGFETAVFLLATFHTGASQPHWNLTVTGKATGPSWQANTQLTAGIRGYSGYVSHNTADLVSHTETFRQAIDAGNMTHAGSSSCSGRTRPWPGHRSSAPVSSRTSSTS